MFQASKFRNLNCTSYPKEQWYNELQLGTRFDLYPIAVTRNRMAFVSQFNSGASIELKSLFDMGKQPSYTSQLLKGHTGMVNAIEFSPFSADILYSGGEDCTVKTWQLETPFTDNSLQNDSVSLQYQNPIRYLKHHPSANVILCCSTLKEISICNMETHTVVYADVTEHHDAITGVCWNYDGSALLTVCQDTINRVFDPRVATGAVQTCPGHTGRKSASIVSCGRLHSFLTAGFNKMQERELMLWDFRNLSKHLHRERVDTGTGVLIPLYDEDTNVLFLGGKGDKSMRSYEIDSSKKPYITLLQQSILNVPTSNMALCVKTNCDVSTCEIDRVLNLSQQSIETIRFEVPRKNATFQFQNDLYPDAKSMTPAMAASNYINGDNTSPCLEPIQLSTQQPILYSNQGNATSANTTTATSSGWTNTPSQTNSIFKMNTTTTTTTAPDTTLFKSTSQPFTAPIDVSAWDPNNATGWGVNSNTFNVLGDEPKHTDSENTQAVVTELSEKAKKLGSIQGNKFKYIEGQVQLKSQTYSTIPSPDISSITSSIIISNNKYWAIPTTGTGGPVYVHPLTQYNRIHDNELYVLNGHTLQVNTMQFNPFHSNILVTGSEDSKLQVWDIKDGIDRHLYANDAKITLRGHDKGVKCMQFHPVAENVLLSGANDASIRIWDIEQSSLLQSLQVDSTTTRMEATAVPNDVSFNYTGALYALACRDKLLRIVDTRFNAIVSSSYVHESSKGQRVVWCTQQNSDYIVTVGFNMRSDRQIALWDHRNLNTPISITNIDHSGSMLYPMYDESSGVLYLAGRGDRTVLTYEVSTAIDTPALYPCSVFNFPSLPICGAVLLPKSMCDIKNIEISRMLILTQQTVEPISFYLPRANKLKQYFQDDLYGPVRQPVSNSTSTDWFHTTTTGACRTEPLTYSIQPEGMVSLSKKEPDAVVVPKVLKFQEQKQKEDQIRLHRIQEFERLRALAYQPTLHNNTGRKINKNIGSDDSDDGWDD